MAGKRKIVKEKNPFDLLLPEMLFGIYCLTWMEPALEGKERSYRNAAEAALDLERGKIRVFTPIRLPYKGQVKNLAVFQGDSQDILGCPEINWKGIKTGLATTPGRLLFNEILPKALPFINGLFKKRGIVNLLNILSWTTGSGLGSLDMGSIQELLDRHTPRPEFDFNIEKIVSKSQRAVIEKALRKRISVTTAHFLHREHRPVEKQAELEGHFSWALELWLRQALDRLRETRYNTGWPHPTWIIRDSGIVDLFDMEGLARLLGIGMGENASLRARPVQISLAGAKTPLARRARRKGLPLTAEKYLREILSPVTVSEPDCRTARSVKLETSFYHYPRVPLGERIWGHCLAKDMPYPDHRRLPVARSGEWLETGRMKSVTEAGIQSARVRSPLACDSRSGICSRCAGLDPWTGLPFKAGDPLGESALSAIRSLSALLNPSPRRLPVIEMNDSLERAQAPTAGRVVFSKVIAAGGGERRILSYSGHLRILGPDGRVLAVHAVPHGAWLHVRNGEQVDTGKLLWEADFFRGASILSHDSGTVEFIRGASIKMERDEDTGRIFHRVRESGNEGESEVPCLRLKNNRQGKRSITVSFPPGSKIRVIPGQEVRKGDLLASIDLSYDLGAPWGFTELLPEILRGKRSDDFDRRWNLRPDQNLAKSKQALNTLCEIFAGLPIPGQFLELLLRQLLRNPMKR